MRFLRFGMFLFVGLFGSRKEEDSIIGVLVIWPINFRDALLLTGMGVPHGHTLFSMPGAPLLNILCPPRFKSPCRADICPSGL